MSHTLNETANPLWHKEAMAESFGNEFKQAKPTIFANH
jgi:hypothetical protein